ELLGEPEQLGQQPVGRLRALREIDQRFLGGKPDLFQRVGRQRNPVAAVGWLDVSGAYPECERIVHRRAERWFAVDKQPEGGKAKRGYVGVRAFELEGNRNLRTGSWGQGDGHRG